MLVILLLTNIVFTPLPIAKASPQLFEPTQMHTAISPNTFTAQDAGIFSQKEFKNFWNRVLFTKPSDNTSQRLDKAITNELDIKQSLEASQIIHMNLLELIFMTI